LQAAILQELTRAAPTLQQVDFARAAKLIDTQL
jgi:hypothetical protein